MSSIDADLSASVNLWGIGFLIENYFEHCGEKHW